MHCHVIAEMDQQMAERQFISGYFDTVAYTSQMYAHAISLFLILSGLAIYDHQFLYVVAFVKTKSKTLLRNTPVCRSCVFIDYRPQPCSCRIHEPTSIDCLGVLAEQKR